MKVAYVICCNDSVEAVVADDKRLAEAVLEELKEKGFSNWATLCSCGPYHQDMDRDDYADVYYWHIHTADFRG